MSDFASSSSSAPTAPNGREARYGTKQRKWHVVATNTEIQELERPKIPQDSPPPYKLLEKQSPASAAQELNDDGNTAAVTATDGGGSGDGTPAGAHQANDDAYNNSKNKSKKSSFTKVTRSCSKLKHRVLGWVRRRRRREAKRQPASTQPAAASHQTDAQSSSHTPDENTTTTTRETGGAAVTHESTATSTATNTTSHKPSSSSSSSPPSSGGNDFQQQRRSSTPRTTPVQRYGRYNYSRYTSTNIPGRDSGFYNSDPCAAYDPCYRYPHSDYPYGYSRYPRYPRYPRYYDRRPCQSPPPFSGSVFANPLFGVGAGLAIGGALF